MAAMQRWGMALCAVAALSIALSALAQEKAAIAAPENGFDSMRYRLVGPFRGGRSAAVTGVPGKSLLYYFGSTGGGVWRTRDGGGTWENISDGFFGGSIGAVAVSESDPNVLYVGGGEETVRGNVSHGDGVWRSTDAGKTWKHVGLEDTRHIPRIRIHPKNPDLVYVAALGHLYGPNKQRGVFRSKDGGTTWQQSLFVNDEVGAVDLTLDPTNPRVLYATTWRVKRTPYSLESGGPGSALWKSTDGGDTWKQLSAEIAERASAEKSATTGVPIAMGKGLPKGTLGIIGVTVSPVNPDRVWAIVEAEDGGVFRSDDAGATWTRTSEDRNLRQRAWYYTRIYAGTKSADEVYVVNVGLWRSVDGGKIFSPIRTPHSDHHDLWIDPADPTRMIVADDGGAQVTTDGGSVWTTYHNQPTAQFYRVTTDNHFPYRIYGAQQDNSTVRIASRSDGFGITERDWEASAGAESGWLAPHPTDADIVYGGNYGGYIERVNHRTQERRNVTVWPDNPIGHAADKLKYRFQWNFPIVFSPHDPHTLYTGGNVLFKTDNEGQSWQAISPDLTRNDKRKQGSSGGPITKDNTSVEYYCTIFTALESPHEKGVIWTGSDDGLVHVTRDSGKTWKNVTPPDLPEWSQINSIEAHPTEKGCLYVAATRYKLDDFHPYLYKTTDYGASWKKIVSGIKDDDFTRVIRAARGRPGLLFAGTENGIYVSFDDGARWQRFQLNLPLVPITDLAIKNDDLIVATQGRSFWVLDDLTPLYQFKPTLAEKPLHLFTPRAAYRLSGGDFDGPSRTEGKNPPAGVVIHYYLKEAPPKETPPKDAPPHDGPPKDVPSKPVRFALEILDDGGKVIRQFTPTAEKPADKLEPKAGANRLVWDLQYPEAESFPGMILWGGLPRPVAVPGKYQARLRVGQHSETVSFNVLGDPRASATSADYAAQFEFVLSARDKLTETHRAIKQMREIREQLTALTKRLKDLDVIDAAKAIDKQLTAIEESLYQTKARSSQDVLNYPIRLNNRLSSVAAEVGTGDYRPTDQAVKLKNELTAAIDAELAKLHKIIGDDLVRFNDLLARKKIPGVFADIPGASEPKP